MLNLKHLQSFTRPQGRRWRQRVRRREESTRVTNGAGEGHIDQASGGEEVEVSLAPNGQDPGELGHRGGQPGGQILGLHIGDTL